MAVEAPEGRRYPLSAPDSGTESAEELRQCGAIIQ
jgi:hypothetical protein